MHCRCCCRWARRRTTTSRSSSGSASATAWAPSPKNNGVAARASRTITVPAPAGGRGICLPHGSLRCALLPRKGHPRGPPAKPSRSVVRPGQGGPGRLSTVGAVLEPRPIAGPGPLLRILHSSPVGARLGARSRDLEPNRNSREGFDLAEHPALHPDGTEVRVRPGAAEEIRTAADQRPVCARLDANTDA